MSQRIAGRRRAASGCAAAVVFSAIVSLQLSVAVVRGAEQAAPPPAGKSFSDQIERKIVKEPKYASTPRYAILVFGTKLDSKVWMVEDGKTLYVDKNANGDLTDDGDPIAPTNLREWQGDGPKFDFDYLLDKIEPAGGAKHTAFRLARWNYGDQPSDSYGLAVTLDGRTPMYAGWFSTFWSATPQTAPPVHFGGPLQPKLLRHKEYAVGGNPTRLSVGFFNSDGGEGATSRLSIYALPPEATPIVRIDWPVEDGAVPLQTSCKLAERCCYWEFFDPEFVVPAGAVPGTAKATISLSEGDFPLELKTNQIEFPVRAKGSIKEEEL